VCSDFVGSKGASVKHREVDVVIPVYNGARFLAEAVRSAAEQTLPPARILICDDGSTDDTPLIAQRLAADIANVEHLRLPHGGESAARNGGITASTAPYIAFLDADDVWMPRKLEAQMAVFASANENVGIVHSAYEHIDERGAIIEGEWVFQPRLKGDIFRQILLENYVVSGSASSVVVKRNVLDKAGRFDERLFYGADRDMWIRLAAFAHFDYAPEPLVRIRVHGNSVQRFKAKERAIDFYLQRVLMLSKWENIVLSEPEVCAELRRRALLLLLPRIREPKRIDAFYKALHAQGSVLARSLFPSRGDLWLSLLQTLGRYGAWRLRRHILNERRPFLE